MPAQVRPRVTRIDVAPGANGSGPRRDLRHRIDRADRIRGPAERDQPRPRREHAVEILHAQRAILEARLPVTDGQASVCSDFQPRVHVGLVVEAGHHDLVARLERRADRAGDMERQGRHVRAEGDLVAIDAQEVAERDVRPFDDCIRPARGPECAAVIGVRLAVIVPDRRDDAAWDLRSTWSIEEGDGPVAVRQGQSGEAAPKRLDVKSGHPLMLARTPTRPIRGHVNQSGRRMLSVQTLERPPAKLTARDPRLAPWRAFMRAHAQLSRRLDEDLRAEHGLSHQEYVALLFLAESPDRRLRMGRLAEVLILSKSGATRLIDRLLQDGRPQGPAPPSPPPAPETRPPGAALHPPPPPHP